MQVLGREAVGAAGDVPGRCALWTLTVFRRAAPTNLSVGVAGSCSGPAVLDALLDQQGINYKGHPQKGLLAKQVLSYG